MPPDRYAIIPQEVKGDLVVRHPRKVVLPEDKPLTRRQRRFVDELVAGDGAITLREAAERAGYSVSCSNRVSYELTNPMICPHVVAAIRRARDEQDKKYAIDHKRHLRDLQRIRDAALAAGAYGAAVQAEYRRGMAHGQIYIHKSEVRHGSIDQMSREEVLRALQEISSNGGRIIDVSPTPGGRGERDDTHREGPGEPSLGHHEGRPEGDEVDLDEGGDLGDPGLP